MQTIEQRITDLRQQIESLQKELRIAQCGQYKCYICGEQATNRHMSIMGQIPFYVCKKHYKETGPGHGGGQMGLVNVETGRWVEMAYYGERMEATQ